MDLHRQAIDTIGFSHAKIPPRCSSHGCATFRHGWWCRPNHPESPKIKASTRRCYGVFERPFPLPDVRKPHCWSSRPQKVYTDSNKRKEKERRLMNCFEMYTAGLHRIRRSRSSLSERSTCCDILINVCSNIEPKERWLFWNQIWNFGVGYWFLP